MGNHAAKRELSAEKGNKGAGECLWVQAEKPSQHSEASEENLPASRSISYLEDNMRMALCCFFQDSEGYRGESEKKKSLRDLSQEASEDSDVFGEADVEQNNGTPLQDTAVTDSKCTANPKNAWPDANPADPGGRPHLIRLFSRDAPGREDNTFKDRPSESDELQTIQEDSAAAPEGLDVMASQKRPSQRHGSKYLASASTIDHARHGFLPRHRDTGILDSLGRFFGADRGAPKRGSGKVSSEE
uniref:Myelin basic protein n=1 Tax=Sus scrofa TaxID=9823 RepID=A0A8D0NXL1_PIG